MKLQNPMVSPVDRIHPSALWTRDEAIALVCDVFERYGYCDEALFEHVRSQTFRDMPSWKHVVELLTG